MFALGIYTSVSSSPGLTLPVVFFLKFSSFAGRYIIPCHVGHTHTFVGILEVEQRMGWLAAEPPVSHIPVAREVLYCRIGAEGIGKHLLIRRLGVRQWGLLLSYPWGLLLSYPVARLLRRRNLTERRLRRLSRT